MVGDKSHTVPVALSCSRELVILMGQLDWKVVTKSKGEADKKRDVCLKNSGGKFL